MATDEFNPQEEEEHVEQENPWLVDEVVQEPKDYGIEHYDACMTEHFASGEYDDEDSNVDDTELVYDDMRLFFSAIGEPQLIDKFIENKVTLAQLLEFEEQDLINCGIDLVGDRKKIMAHLGQMHCDEWLPTSLHDLTQKSMMTGPGLYISINGINKHLEYIGVTFRYISRKLQLKPEILELGKDYVGVKKVASELEDVDKTCKNLRISLNKLINEIQKHVDDPILKPANHIDAKYVKSIKIRRRIFPAVLMSIGGLVAYKAFRYFTS